MIEKYHEIVSLAHHIWNVISAISLDDDVENKCNAFQLDIGSIVNRGGGAGIATRTAHIAVLKMWSGPQTEARAPSAVRVFAGEEVM
jgi:hypothetical protein